MIGMTLSYGRAVASILVATIALTACSSAPQGTRVTAPEPVRQAYTAADVHFMSAMIAHHAQAIDISRWAPTHGASPSLQTLAERAINAQQDEIALMQRWLRDRRLPVPEARATPMKMTMGGVEHEHRMPGMLTEDQLKQLDQGRGREFDRLFLTF